VRLVESAAQALEAIQSWKPDVMVSDIEMPEEDGYTLIEKSARAPGPGGCGDSVDCGHSPCTNRGSSAGDCCRVRVSHLETDRQDAIDRCCRCSCRQAH
jgi:CheY-like chemotaxis protein